METMKPIQSSRIYPQFAQTVNTHGAQPAPQFGALWRTSEKKIGDGEIGNTGGGPSQPDGKKGLPGRIFRAVQWGLIALALPGSWLAAKVIETNPPGVLSVVFDKTNGGFQDKVNGPGLVSMGLKAAIPGSVVENYPINGTTQSVLERIEVFSQEGRKIGTVVASVDYRVNPKKVKQALEKLQAADSSASIPDTTTFYKTDDAKVQRLYLMFVRNLLRATISDLATAIRGTSFFKNHEFLQEALNVGLPNVAVKVQSLSDTVDSIKKGETPTDEQQGGIRLLNTQPLKEQVEDLIIIEDGGVKILHIELPTDMETALETRAKQPLEELVAVLRREAQETHRQKNEEEARKKVVENEETARQAGIINALRAEGQIDIQAIIAERFKIEAETKAESAAIVATAEQEGLTLEATAAEEAAQITWEANQYSRTRKAEADGLVASAAGRGEAAGNALLKDTYRRFPNLQKLQAIRGSGAALQALGNNPDFRVDYLDPGTGLSINLMNIGNGNASSEEGGVSRGGIIEQIVGRTIADKAAPAKGGSAPVTAPEGE